MLKSYEAFIYDVNKIYTYTLRPDKEEKITPPGVNFINILLENFLYESASRSFSLVTKAKM